MHEKQYQIAMGGLLHDIGKIVYRTGDRRSHTESGYTFLQQTGIVDCTILQQVRFHHGKNLKQASLPKDSLAYITYIADNIASAADRREAEEPEYGFSREEPQDSIFNRLNGNDGKCKYAPKLLTEEINFPTERPAAYDKHFYLQCLTSIQHNLRGICLNDRYLNSLLDILEANLTYVPSSTSRKETADISLFDHSKMTAAIGCCIWEYLNEKGVSDYKTELYKAAEQFYDKKVFLLYSIDLSGIQDFIYTITSDGALKALRARSFYLELLMEHLVDTLLHQVGLSRANCIYTGGGHSYLLLANTNATKAQIQQFEEDTNTWMLQTFGTALYLAGGYAPCSANDLSNKPNDSYRKVFRQVSTEISSRKLHRYSAAQIVALTMAAGRDNLRECALCHRTDRLTDDEKCAVCAGLETFSKQIQTKQFFAVTKTQDKTTCLPLPDGCFLSAETESGLKQRMKQDGGYQHSYAKNDFYTGQEIATKVWVGDYQNGDSFQQLAQGAEGIRRLAVLRGDIDNLGQAFVQGFESEKYGQRYVALSRTATFSRSLSLFFKRHINGILRKGKYSLTDRDGSNRIATIVYSGGDDVFIIGAWSDIVGFAVDLYESLTMFAQKKLTISAGIGIYPEKYPVSAMAKQTGELEDLSKSYPGKNAVTLFDAGNTYSWETFINHVLEEKYMLIYDFFSSMKAYPEPSNEDGETANLYGKSFLYRLLELMREYHKQGSKINLARYAYLLARMQPEENAPEAHKALYHKFSSKMYEWMKDAEQCRQAITAIYMYVYTIREGGTIDED